jgi:ABC-type sugar transport system substrate-binding protein
MSRFLSAQRVRVAAAGVTVAFGCAIATAGAAHSDWNMTQKGAAVPRALGIRDGIAAARKELCKKPNYKIGFDTYSATQEFAAAENKGVNDLAKQLGCVTIVMLSDNADAPTAIANVRTMIEQHIVGLYNSNVVSASQLAIDKLVKAANIPQSNSGGQTSPGAPTVVQSHYQAGYDAGIQLGIWAKKLYPKDTAPYLMNGIDEPGGALQYQEGQGQVDGLHKYFPNLPKSHIILVSEDGTGPTAYKSTLSALSLVPADGLALLTSTDTDTNAGMYQAAKARHRTKFLVVDQAGASLGLTNLCKYPEYVASIDFNPPSWGLWSLPAVIEMINGVKLPPDIPIPTKLRTKANYCHK